jgi:twinkle protein
MATWESLGIALPYGASGEVRVQCPWCTPTRKNKRDKDLAVNVEEGLYQCHHCGEKGSINPGRTGYGARLKVYERPKPIEPPLRSAMQRMYDWFQRERGISREVVERNRVTVEINEKTLNEVIAFPYYRNGEHVHTTYRAYDKKFWQSKDTERIFYGLDDITPDTTEVIICEGQIDKLAFEMAGYTNVLSVPDGAPNANGSDFASKFSYLASATELFTQFTHVYLAGDNDPNGQAMNAELGRRIGVERCREVRWPEGIKDANDCLLTIGPAMIQECVANAVPYPVEGIVYPDDILDKVEHLYDHGFDPGVTVGLYTLDQHYRPRKALMSIVTGYPSHGKSLFIDQLLTRIAKRHDWRFAYFSPENQPLERHYANIAEIYVGKPFNRGFTDRMTKEELYDTHAWINDHFSFILPETPHIDTILELATVLRFQKGIDGIVIDPWNEMEHAKPAHMNGSDYISEVLSKLNRFKTRSNIHIWLLAHPTKYQFQQGESYVPKLNDIAGSYAFRAKADYGLTIWRDPNDTSIPSQCHIEKVRFSETGKPGLIEFRYDPRTRQIEEV